MAAINNPRRVLMRHIRRLRERLDILETSIPAEKKAEKKVATRDAACDAEHAAALAADTVYTNAIMARNAAELVEAQAGNLSAIAWQTYEECIDP